MKRNYFDFIIYHHALELSLVPNRCENANEGTLRDLEHNCAPEVLNSEHWQCPFVSRSNKHLNIELLGMATNGRIQKWLRMFRTSIKYRF